MGTSVSEAVRHATALQYVEAGFPLIRLNGKRACDKGWPDTEPMWTEQLPGFLKRCTGNFGVTLGKQDLVIDVDPRRYPTGRKVIKEFMHACAVSQEALLDIASVVRTGSGGFHIYMKKPTGVNIHRSLEKTYPGLEFKSYGQYLVGASSIHPDTGEPYTVLGGRSFKELRTAPPSLLSLICKAAKPEVLTQPETLLGLMDDVTAVTTRYQEYLTRVDPAVEGEHGDTETYKVACRGKDMGLSPEKTLNLMIHYYNPRCSPPWDLTELATKVHNAYEYATETTGNALPETQFKPVPISADIHPLWRGWDLNKQNGQKKKTQNNTFNHFIVKGSELAGTLQFDEFAGRVMIATPLPWMREGDTLPREWTDHDSVELRLYLSRVKRFDVPIAYVDQAVESYSRTSVIHPLKDYLRALKWDGQARVDTFLTQCCGAPAGRYSRGVSRVLFLQAVNRALHPGCKADYVVVFESSQGQHKSQMLEVLGGEWYADLIIDTHNKDTVDAMRGKWWIEIAEMEVTRRAEAQALKAFITRSVDRVRLAYGRRSLDLPRSCIFAGTINPDALGQYLNDATGNRRFMPVPIKHIDLKAVTEQRDQLFAEAVHRLGEGEKPWITDKATIKEVEIEQAMRQTDDPWQTSITEYISLNEPSFISTKDLYIFALKGSEAQLNPQHSRRIAHCIRTLGYTKCSKRINGKLARGYEHQGRVAKLKAVKKLMR